MQPSPPSSPSRAEFPALTVATAFPGGTPVELRHLGGSMVRPSGRETDFVAPRLGAGCTGCGRAYCRDRVAARDLVGSRWRGLDGGAVALADRAAWLGLLERHVTGQPWPKLANRCGARAYSYDVPAGHFAAAVASGAFGDVVARWRSAGKHRRARPRFTADGLDAALIGELVDLGPAGPPLSASGVDDDAVAPGGVTLAVPLAAPAITGAIAPGYACPLRDGRLAEFASVLRALGYRLEYAFTLHVYEGWLDDLDAAFAALAPALTSARPRVHLRLPVWRPSERLAWASAGANAAASSVSADVCETVGAGEPHEAVRVRYELRRGVLREAVAVAGAHLPDRLTVRDGRRAGGFTFVG